MGLLGGGGKGKGGTPKARPQKIVRSRRLTPEMLASAKARERATRAANKKAQAEARAVKDAAKGGGRLGGKGGATSGSGKYD